MYYNRVRVCTEAAESGGGEPLFAAGDVPPKLEGESADEHNLRVALARAHKFFECYKELSDQCKM